MLEILWTFSNCMIFSIADIKKAYVNLLSNSGQTVAAKEIAPDIQQTLFTPISQQQVISKRPTTRRKFLYQLFISIFSRSQCSSTIQTISIEFFTTLSLFRWSFIF